MRLFLASLLLTLAPACIGSGLVASGHFDGSGGFWTDGNVAVAVGEYEGDFSMFGVGPAAGVEIIFPVSIQDGFVYAVNRSLDEAYELPIEEPLPAWAAAVFRPGEAEALGLTFIE